MNIGTLQKRKPGDERGWRATPAFDQMTLDVALAAFDEMKLGRGAGTDVLAVSFSATDYTGHRFGTKGAEMCSQMMALDATLGRLCAALDKAKMPWC
jgi:alkaline phosphatase